MMKEKIFELKEREMWYVMYGNCFIISFNTLAVCRVTQLSACIFTALKKVKFKISDTCKIELA